MHAPTTANQGRVTVERGRKREVTVERGRKDMLSPGECAHGDVQGKKKEELPEPSP